MIDNFSHHSSGFSYTYTKTEENDTSSSVFQSFNWKNELMKSLPLSRNFSNNLTLRSLCSDDPSHLLERMDIKTENKQLKKCQNSEFLNSEVINENLLTEQMLNDRSKDINSKKETEDNFNFGISIETKEMNNECRCGLCTVF